MTGRSESEGVDGRTEGWREGGEAEERVDESFIDYNLSLFYLTG